MTESCLKHFGRVKVFSLSILGHIDPKEKFLHSESGYFIHWNISIHVCFIVEKVAVLMFIPQAKKFEFVDFLHLKTHFLPIESFRNLYQTTPLRASVGGFGKYFALKHQ